MNIKLMLDTKKFENKPTGYETGGVQSRIAETEINIEDLAIGLCNGMTCRPALLNGTHAADWIQQQVFMLDFDHDTTIDEEINKCNTLGLIPTFIYTSFNHSDQEHRFRMIFISDEVITDGNIRDLLQATLIGVFGNVDEKCINRDRLFFGGKGKIPINPNYDININANDVINKYYKEDYKKYIPIYNTKKVNIKQTPPNMTNTLRIDDYCDYLDNVDAIIELDVNKLKCLIDSQLKGVLNKEYTLLSSTISSTLLSEHDVYEYINNINLCDFLNIEERYPINCILPNHEDNAPSASVWTTNDGTMIYKCFGCGKALTIITLVEELAQCKRSKAIEFIKSVYNIKLYESDWTKEQKEIMKQNALYLDTEEFKIAFPNISKLIRTRKTHIQLLLLYFSQFITEELRINDKPLFYGGYKKLMEVCGINPNKSITFSQSLTLFALLNMLDKVELQRIPIEELNKAKSISAKYGFKKLTNFYQFEEYGSLAFNNSEKIAKNLIENNISFKGLSREYLLRTFGIDTCDKVYPQYLFANAKGNTEKSDKLTLELSKDINEKIDIQGYVLERDIRGKGKTEIQWKRSIQEILDTYGLVRIKASKINKDIYKIPLDVQYQCFVLCRAI